MERPGQLIGRSFPTLGGGGHGLARLGVVLGETLHQRHDDVEGLLAVRDLWIEVVGLGEIAEQQRARRDGGLDGCLPWPTACDQQRERRGKKNEWEGKERKEAAHRRTRKRNAKRQAVGLAFAREKTLRAGLLRRLRGAQFLEALVDRIHAPHQIFLDLLSFGAVHDAQLRNIADDVGGQRQEAREDTLILER